MQVRAEGESGKTYRIRSKEGAASTVDARGTDAVRVMANKAKVAPEIQADAALRDELLSAPQLDSTANQAQSSPQGGPVFLPPRGLSALAQAMLAGPPPVERALQVPDLPVRA